MVLDIGVVLHPDLAARSRGGVALWPVQEAADLTCDIARPGQEPFLETPRVAAEQGPRRLSLWRERLKARVI
jgi:hypothetical protein